MKKEKGCPCESIHPKIILYNQLLLILLFANIAISAIIVLSFPQVISAVNAVDEEAKESPFCYVDTPQGKIFGVNRAKDIPACQEATQ